MKLFRPRSKIRTLFILGRVSNLPTVWSNCLAGWWLGGGWRWWQLAWVSISVSFLYLGGMFLNDAFDANFDRERRRTRPIPSGAISEKEVWQWGFAWLAIGAAGLIWAGKTTAILTLFLTGCILLYNAIHKLAAASPVLTGACRFLVYLVSASFVSGFVDGRVLWSGLAVGAYVTGLGFFARNETGRGPVPWWPAVLLAAPVVLAALADDDGAQSAGLVLSLVLAVWVLLALQSAFRRAERNVGFAVSRLLAGISLVDLLAVGDLSRPWIVLFAAWFVLALVLQRYVPAT